MTMDNVLLNTNKTITTLMDQGTKKSLLTAQSLLVAYKMACDELRNDEMLSLSVESQIEAVCYQDGLSKDQISVLTGRYSYLIERSERLLYGYSDEVGGLYTSSDEFYYLSLFISESLTNLKAYSPDDGYFEFEYWLKMINNNLNRLEQILVESIQTLINRFQLLLMHEGELNRRYSAFKRLAVATTIETPLHVKNCLTLMGAVRRCFTSIVNLNLAQKV